MSHNPGGNDALGIILVHGYLGSPENLLPLVDYLVQRYGADAVNSLCLPGHGSERVSESPPFDESAFLAALADAIDQQLRLGRRLVLIGHSTGGSLLLTEIARRLAANPASLNSLLLLVLCATPPRIDFSYTGRWSEHTAERFVQVDDVGAIVSLVNRLVRRPPLAVPAPVLIVHGEDDELVPVADVPLWRNGRFARVQQHVRIAGAGHHLLIGEGAALVIDVIGRAIHDALQSPGGTAASTLFDAEPGLEGFCANWPATFRHVIDSPAGRQAVGRGFEPGVVAESEPTLANIEITTRCTLGCVACARTQLKLKSRFMSRDDFCRVLGSLPHACRIVLVGLGEPLLHPEVIDFIRIAVAEGRRVGLVTNAMNLDSGMAQALCASGLSSITFSLDAVHQAYAESVRQGSDMALISANIHNLINARRRLGCKLSISVFTALSMDTIDEFEAIVDFVADHEIDAMMVTDLNFSSNQYRSVHDALTRGHARILRKALKKALARRLPVLSVWGLEEFALDSRYLDYLLLRGEQLAHRSTRRTHCLSPWQTIPVNVEGNLTLCDCQPGAVIGNIHKTPVSAWWNGSLMREQRQRMLSDNPPECCRVCPRF